MFTAKKTLKGVLQLCSEQKKFKQKKSQELEKLRSRQDFVSAGALLI